MDKKTISTMKKMFDDIMHTTDEGTVEFWYARELMGCLQQFIRSHLLEQRLQSDVLRQCAMEQNVRRK